jgi:hypothetical protein
LARRTVLGLIRSAPFCLQSERIRRSSRPILNVPIWTRSAQRSKPGGPAVLDTFRYRLAVSLWPALLLERDPRVLEIVRISFRAGQTVRLPCPRSAADDLPADLTINHSIDEVA